MSRETRKAAAPAVVSSADAPSSFSPRDDIQRAVRQRLLHGQSIGDRRSEPSLDFVALCENNWHGLGMDRGDLGVRIGRPKPEQLVLAFDQVGFRAAPS